MMDAMKEAMERKKKGAMKIEIYINGDEQKMKEDEDETGASPVVKDKKDDKEIIAQDAIEMEDDEDEDDDEMGEIEAQNIRAILGKELESPKGSKPMTLDELAKEKMRARLGQMKK